jgi:N utilization substance protein B
MSNRHLARTIAMQILFEWDFNNRSQKLNEVIDYNIKEFGMGLESDLEFIEKLVRGVTKHMAEIDTTIVKYAPEWPIDKITIMDRSVLRLGIYELMIAKEVPPKVAINESIEVAKTYGGESSSRFVNGVLGAVYREIQSDEEGIITPESLKRQKMTDNNEQTTKL